MNSKVVITADENGNIISVSPNNPEYGSIRVESVVNQINNQGWLKPVKRTAFIKGLIKDLHDANFKSGQVLPGRIIVKESFAPFNPINPEKNLKIAGETGIVCRVDDQPIYRQTFYTEDSNAQDELITHNNGEEIREVQAATRTMSWLNKADIEALAAL